MAPLLPRPFRTALTVEPYHIDDEELGDDIPQREARRRRIETIANQYLTGTVPFIQSAALRGPFNADWKNPWSRKREPVPRKTSSRSVAPTAAGRSRRRQFTREPSLRPIEQRSARPTARAHVTTDLITRDREREAKAEAERAEEEKRRAKAERREHRRQELAKRKERATEVQKDGLGKSPAQPIDLTADDYGAGLPAGPTFAVLQSGVYPEEDDADDITRSREYGAREIRSSFTDEWLSRLASPARNDSPARTPELSPVQAYVSERAIDAIEALTPTKRPPKYRNPEKYSSSQPGQGHKSRRERPRSSAPEPEGHKINALHSRISSSSDVRLHGAVPKKSTRTSRDPPSTDAATEHASRQNSSQHQRSERAVNGIGSSRVRHTASKRTQAEGGIPSSLHVNLNEESLPKPNSIGRKELAEDMRAIRKNMIPTSTFPEVSRNHPSGFTPINQRFTSPPPGLEEPIESTTPAGRPVLGSRSAAYNTNPVGSMRPPFHTRNEGVLVMSAGDLRLDTDLVYAIGKDLEGQENSIPSKDGSKVREGSLLKGALVQSSEKCVTSERARTRKPRKAHPLQASPTATNSQGFTYRKVSDPTENIPKLQPSSQSTKRALGQKRIRTMTFGSLPMGAPEAPIPEHLDPENIAADNPVLADAADGELTALTQDGQVDRGTQSNLPRDLSTQAAILFAQQEFQQEFKSPAKEHTVPSLGIEISSQQTTSTPAPSQSPMEYAAVTPFKEFNEGKLFLDDNPPQLAPVPMSTQELFNAASPFAFSTVKKNKNKRKRVSLAASPLKFVDDRGAEVHNAKQPTDEGITPSQTGLDGDTTIDVTIAKKCTTPPTSKLPSSAPNQPSSGLKPHSVNPTLSSAMKIKPSRFMTSSRVTSQATSSFSRLGQPPSSAPQPTSSHALRQEYRRAQSQSRSQKQSQSQSQSQGSQQRLSQQHQQPAQRWEQGWDVVDLNSAIDAADSFLDSAKLM